VHHLRRPGRADVHPCGLVLELLRGDELHALVVPVPVGPQHLLRVRQCDAPVVRVPPGSVGRVPRADDVRAGEILELKGVRGRIVHEERPVVELRHAHDAVNGHEIPVREPVRRGRDDRRGRLRDARDRGPRLG